MRMGGLIAPAWRALAQCDEPLFLGVVLRSAAWSALAFVVLGSATGWLAWQALAHSAWLGWLGPVLGVVVAALAALFLFQPLAATLASLAVERVSAAVETRFYPGLPAAAAAPLAQQVWDGIALGLAVLAMQVLALVLAFVIPGLGLLLGWAVAAWAIGRGLFVAVAMRRMDRPAAKALYRRRRWAVLAQGGLVTAFSFVPVVNIFAAVIGIAAMVHVLHQGERAQL